MTVIFVFGDIQIQVNPEKDLSMIFKNGFPIWSGTGDRLIEILKSVHEDK
jgi:hypothetical protein